MRCAAYVDGFNLYHFIEFEPQLKWLDIRQLITSYLLAKDTLERVTYFTALAHWKPVSMEQHRLFLRALESTGVNVQHGKFRKGRKYCPACKKDIKCRQEKRTDVNIATAMISDAYEHRFEKAVLVTGDADLAPAVELIRFRFPALRVTALTPLGRKARELESVCNENAQITSERMERLSLPR
jgi:Protein of unknown function DUF88.